MIMREPESFEELAGGNPGSPGVGSDLEIPFIEPYDEPIEELPPELVLAFAPLDKRAFGVATGLVSGLFFFLLTLFHLVIEPGGAIDLSLLAQYFYGYTVSWHGALLGAFWGFAVGFVGGWFAAFTRNVMIALSIFLGRSRAELQETRDFLDHI